MRAARFATIYLLHGRGGWPGGSVLQIEEVLRKSLPDLRYIRPSLPHGREKGVQAAAKSLEFVEGLNLEPASLLVGISLGGLVAAKLQEAGREDLHVICISSPTSDNGTVLESRTPNRVALYSSNDDVIAGRTANWPQLAEAFDIPWLSHDTDAHKEALGRWITAYIAGASISEQVLAEL